jgi:UDP-N-acetylglucosamine 2-epimerase (non-hydrolysing)
MKKIVLVAGARPNFMKIAPILRAINEQGGFEHVLVHTGQHYDANMSDSFFSTLGIKAPDYNLNVGSGSHAFQTAKIMIGFEKICVIEQPDIVLVVGDVNSTIAAALTAKKLNIQIAHVEAGLRSGDRKMPEEINRLATDAITDFLFTTEEEASKNLLKEGHPQDKVYFVGHVMIDNLFYQLEKIRRGFVSQKIKKIKKKLPLQYICMTLHRPSNVDSKEVLSELLIAIKSVTTKVPVLFPCHPRTWKQIVKYDLEGMFVTADSIEDSMYNGIVFMEPLDFNDFLYLWKDSTIVLTDSGGIQEETSALNVPCITIRENTERPITVEMGTNVLVGNNIDKLNNEIEKAISKNGKKGQVPPLWDGNASIRIVDILSKIS